MNSRLTQNVLLGLLQLLIIHCMQAARVESFFCINLCKVGVKV